MDIKVFNLTSGVNETRFLVQHRSCKSKCKFSKSLFNIKWKWNHDECQCECKELDNWGYCKKDCMWNPSLCDCERSKACKIDNYLDAKSYSCEKRLITKLVSACEDEVLNTTEASPCVKLVTFGKSNYLIHIILMIII